LRAEFVVVGQAGKAFNSLKDPNSENAYADQIDIRGIYPDKLAAVNSLFNRRTGNSSYDKNEDNYLDFPEVRDEVAQTFLSVLFNKVVEDVTFTTADGRQFVQEKLHYPLFSSPEDNRKQASIHWIEAPLSSQLAQRMGLPATEISFQQMMVNIAVSGMQTPGRRLDRGLIEQISIIRDTQLRATNSTDSFDIIDIGARRYYATEKTPIARQLFAFSKINTTLDKIERKKVIEYFNKKVQERRTATAAPAAAGGSLGGALAGLFGSGQASSGAAAAPAPAVDPEIAAMDQFKLEEIQAYLQGAIMKNSELEYILTFLPAL